MKKISKGAFLFLSLFALLACSSNKTENNEQKNNEQNNTSENTENNENNNENNNNENNNQENQNDNEPFVENELSIENGLKIKFSNIGAKIDSINFGDTKIGEKGFVPIRVANRIANGTFELDGVTYNVTKNNGKHTLHGGYNNMAQDINWTKTKQNAHEIVFEYNSPDKEQGFPGNMHISTTYTLKTDGTLDIEFRAKSDAKTLFNPTNHLYMNMNGITGGWGGSYSGNSLWVDANKYTKADSDLIPTGEIATITDAKLNYTTKKAYQGDNDTNVVLNGEGYRKVAELTGDTSGITCEVFTDRVGLQIYNDNSHICLEAQDFPDAIHHDNFPSIVLEANEEYYSKTSYKFSK